jgi:hypothetical protein
MTQPFTWPANEWGGGSNVYDVRSYGATPADVGPGIQGALNAIQANKGGVVFIPPLLNGEPWRWVTPVVKDFASSPNSVEIQGARSWVQLELANNTATALTLQNVTGVTSVRGLTITGDQARTSDVGHLFDFQFCTESYVEDCSLWGVGSVANNGFPEGLLLWYACSLVAVRNLTLYGCAYAGPLGGSICFRNVVTALVHGVRFQDFESFGGVGYNRGASRAQIYARQASTVDVDACFIDENTTNTLWVDATGGGVINRVRIHGTYANIPANPGAFLLANGAGSIRVDSCELHNGFAGNPLADLTSVSSLDWLRTNPTANTTVISSRTGNGTIRLQESTGITVDVTSGGNAWPSTLLEIDGVPAPYRVNHAGSPHTLLGSQRNVLADVSGGAISLTVPQTTTVTDGQRFTLAVPAGNAAVNNITITRTGSDTLQDPANVSAAPGTSVTYAINGGSATWEACATEQQWRVVAKVA